MWKTTSIARRASVIALAAAAGASMLTLFAVGLGPRTGRYRTLTVLSGSMAPAIPTGSLVVVTPVDPADVRVGQVITYQAPTDGRVVTHRVARVLEGGRQPVVVTKGDANDTADPWAARLTSSPVWTVRFSVPGVGRAIVWLRSPAVRRLTVLLVPALLVAVWLIRIWARPAAGRAARTGGGHAVPSP